MKFYYGITHIALLEAAIQAVVDVFPASNASNTEGMLLGTAIAETHLGTYPDAHPERHGVGLMQMDRIAFDDVQERTRATVKGMCKHRLFVDMAKVKYEDLAHCPLLSVLYARLFYMLVPDVFPEEDDVESQARYWKRFYNTEAGSGTAEDFITRHLETEKKFKAFRALLAGKPSEGDCNEK